MNNQFTIEDAPMTPAQERLFDQAYNNLMWFSEHAQELSVFSIHRGRYVATAGEELFVADTPEDVERLARQKHPDEMPHIRYITREKLSRVYACLR